MAASYDRELIAQMLEGTRRGDLHQFSVESIERAISQLRAADNADAAGVHTARRLPPDGIHTCSYQCDQPECIRAQRDDLAAQEAALAQDRASLPDPVPGDQVADIVARWIEKGLSADVAMLVIKRHLDHCYMQPANDYNRGYVAGANSVTERAAELVAAAESASQGATPSAPVGDDRWKALIVQWQRRAEAVGYDGVEDALDAAIAAKSAPVGVIEDAARHLSNWLDLNECECEFSHQCGRTEVEQTRDQLRALLATQQPAGGELPHGFVAVDSAALLAVHSALSRSIGDTDPYVAPDATDEEVHDELPVFWAAQQIAFMLAAAPTPQQPVSDDAAPTPQKGVSDG